MLSEATIRNRIALLKLDLRKIRDKQIKREIKAQIRILEWVVNNSPR